MRAGAMPVSKSGGRDWEAQQLAAQVGWARKDFCVSPAGFDRRQQWRALLWQHLVEQEAGPAKWASRRLACGKSRHSTMSVILVQRDKDRRFKVKRAGE